MMVLRAAKRHIPGFSLMTASIASYGCLNIEAVNHYDLSVQQLDRYKSLQVITADQLENGNYRSLGEIHGLSYSSEGESFSEANAFDQVRLRATLAGAYAISPPVCTHSTGTNWKNAGMQLIICTSKILVVGGEEPVLKPATPISVE